MTFYQQKNIVCRFLAAVLLLIAIRAEATETNWIQFKQHFVEPSGRVLSAGQDGISHSEGQGYAMLLAVHYADRAAFDQLWQWTKNNLQVRSTDKLMSWSWSPKTGITDKNNASDGDLLVAWALLRAAKKFHAPEYLQAGRKIAQDIRSNLLHRAPQGLILLPGMDGFDKKEGFTINLSYWVFPALDEIAQSDPAPEWAELAKTGITILQYAHFGRWGLPPDWLTLTEKVAPASALSNQFGYDAVRIPLYLLWGRRESPALLKPYREFWGYFKGAQFMPSWTNLTNDSVDSYDTSAAVHKLAEWVLGYPATPAANRYHFDEHQGYYASVLFLLIDVAVSERGQRR